MDNWLKLFVCACALRWVCAACYYSTHYALTTTSGTSPAICPGTKRGKVYRKLKLTRSASIPDTLFFFLLCGYLLCLYVILSYTLSVLCGRTRACVYMCEVVRVRSYACFSSFCIYFSLHIWAIKGVNNNVIFLH